MYGNYDNKKKPPKFDLFLGVDRWDSVDLHNASEIVTKELIHVPPLDYMQICLINTRKGVPFISAIEIRPLDNDTYVASSGSLKLHQRLDYGAERNRSVRWGSFSSLFKTKSIWWTYFDSCSSLLLRYPNDTYDRIWSPPTLSGSENILSSPNHSIELNIFAIPTIVLETAITPTNPHQPLNFSWNTGNKMDQFYIYMHFADLPDIGRENFRAFNVDVNGFHWFESLTPQYLSTTTLYSISGINAVNGSNLTVSIYKNESSSRPPLINAIEIFVEKQFPQLQTNQMESMFSHNLCISSFSLSTITIFSHHIFPICVHNKLIIVIPIHFNTSWCTAENKINIQSEEKLARRSMLPSRILVGRSSLQLQWRQQTTKYHILVSSHPNSRLKNLLILPDIFF